MLAGWNTDRMKRLLVVVALIAAVGAVVVAAVLLTDGSSPGGPGGAGPGTAGPDGQPTDGEAATPTPTGTATTPGATPGPSPSPGEQTATPTPPVRTTPPPALDPPGDQLALGRLEGVDGFFISPEAQLENVRLSAQDVVIAGSQVTMGSVAVDGIVPFSAVAEQVGPGTRVEAAGDGLARVRRTVEVLGRDVDVSATGRVRAEDGQVVVVPQRVEVGGPPWVEDFLGGAVRNLVTIREDVEGLPEGLTLQNVEVVDRGFQVHLTGRDVQFTN